MAEGVEAASCVVRDVVPGAVKGNVLLVAWGLPANAVVQGPLQALRTVHEGDACAVLAVVGAPRMPPK